jgi:hypothetical protein
MQVNRPHNTDIKALTQGITEKPSKASASAETKDSLSVGTAGYVVKALALSMDGAASAAAIEAAKALIASGEIDSPEMINGAARMIVERGF